MTLYDNGNTGYQAILVATDFSPYSKAALQQAVWMARCDGAKITLAHTLPNLRSLVETASYQSKVDFLYGEGTDFHREVQRESEIKMRQLIADVNATSREIEIVTMIGITYLQLTRLVQKNRYDLVLAGTRGMANWEQFFVGSTSKRLIRDCPASVWIVKGDNVKPPNAVLAATDFSEASRKAVLEGLWIANQASADFHLVHVIDSMDVAEEIFSQIPDGGSLRREINEEATRRLDTFVKSLHINPESIKKHLSFGTPWQEVGRLAKHLKVDLIVMGTIGRSGIKGMLLGNTAEKILDTCDCSILTVKPEDFVSPILPGFGPLYPGQESDASEMTSTEET